MKKTQRGRATCPACQGPMKAGAKTCESCQRDGALCRVCRAYHGPLKDGLCRGCEVALAGLAGRREPRPQGWTWPPGHLEALAELAAQKKPLFGG
jgi:DnaJ-class molecular chaperone